MSRNRDLMRVAAVALRDGRDPFSTAFLTEHAVTLDECYDLSDGIAQAIELVLAMPNELLAQAALAAALKED